MKKVYVVSKTHLDLGFTDYAENIKNKYINEFIPNAIAIAEAVNKDRKNFVWTTGSWILNEMLTNGSQKNKRLLTKAIENGSIAPHALPFTLHTELLDYDTLDYGLSLVKKLDRIKGRKTISAKMTDVPGHTKALIPLLYEHGIKLLHIGVNGASALADVPDCFVWKNGKAEVIVIYSGEYGGEYKNENVSDILYFDHTLDNHGAGGAGAVLRNLEEISKKYPDYEIVGGTLDDYAEKLWLIKDKLPVVTSEIGDSWIHGSATDPYKSAALRCLIRYKNKWLEEKSLKRNSKEYRTLCSYILCLAEHTCGMDSKLIEGISDYYLKSDFTSARNSGKFTAIEESWREQRQYINSALEALSEAHRNDIMPEIKALIPKGILELSGDRLVIGRTYSIGGSSVTINSYGGIGSLCINGKCLIAENDKPVLTYNAYNGRDYERWHKDYNRNIEETRHWSLADFGRPNLINLDDKFKAGKFLYQLADGAVTQEDVLKITVNLTIDEYCTLNLGAAQKAQIVYTLDSEMLTVELTLLNKSASRITESTAVHFYPDSSSISYQKISDIINPYDIVKNGNRKLSAVEKVILDGFDIINCHSPLTAIGDGRLMKWDNTYPDLKDGLSFILHNNVWGTNFPLWYEDNSYFKFIIQ